MPGDDIGRFSGLTDHVRCPFCKSVVEIMGAGPSFCYACSRPFVVEKLHKLYRSPFVGRETTADELLTFNTQWLRSVLSYVASTKRWNRFRVVETQ